MHHLGHLSATAAPVASVGMAETDDATTVTMARTIAEDNRIVCDSCDLGSENSEDDSRKTIGFYVLTTVLPAYVVLSNRCINELPAEV